MLAMWATYGPHIGLAQQSAQPTFPSVQEASQTLFQAVQGNDEQALQISWADQRTSPPRVTKAKISSTANCSSKKYKEMHRLGREADGSVILYIGAENWPFPIPLVEKSGAWRFDSDGGSKEVTFRRIGENELTAMDICHESVAAKTGSRSTERRRRSERSPRVC